MGAQHLVAIYSIDMYIVIHFHKEIEVVSGTKACYDFTYNTISRIGVFNVGAASPRKKWEGDPAAQLIKSAYVVLFVLCH